MAELALAAAASADLTAAGQLAAFEAHCARLQALFADAAPAEVVAAMQRFGSRPRHHRHRTQVAVGKGAARSLGLWDTVQRRVLPIDFAAALFSAPILAVLAELPMPRTPAALWRQLNAVHAHSTSAGELCLTLCYARVGAPVRRGRAAELSKPPPEDSRLSAADEAEWRAAAEEFRRRICEGTEGGAEGEAAAVVSACSVVGSWRKHAVVVGSEYLKEEFTLRGGGGDGAVRTLRYQQVYGQFSNPNPAVARDSLQWLSETCRAISEPGALRLLELHCGFGHNTVALAPHFRDVVGVELNRQLAATAERNLELNGVGNANIVRMDSAAYCGGKQQQHDVLLVDPPRAGLDAPTLALAARFRHVLYISCDPNSLRANLDGATIEQHAPQQGKGGEHSVAPGSLPLLATHAVVRMAAFDMFPATGHVEMGVYLQMN